MFYVHEKCKISHLLKFSKIMQQHTVLKLWWVKINIGFVGHLVLFAVVKAFCKSIKN